MNNRDPITDSWGAPSFKLPQSEKIIYSLLVDFTSNICLLLVKQDPKQSPDTTLIP